jgi:hypothetical protein
MMQRVAEEMVSQIPLLVARATIVGRNRELEEVPEE